MEILIYGGVCPYKNIVIVIVSGIDFGFDLTGFKFFDGTHRTQLSIYCFKGILIGRRCVETIGAKGIVDDSAQEIQLDIGFFQGD